MRPRPPPALLLFGFALCVVLAEVVAVEHADPDLWGRLSVGAVLAQTGHLPRIEDFSYTAAGAPWVDHEWLAGVVFYQVLDVGGEPALVLLKYGLLAVSLAAVFALVRLHGASPLWAAYGTVLASPVFLLGYITTVRAQAFSFPLFLWTVWWLEAVRLGRVRARWLGALLPVAVFWGNAHGGFIMGSLAIGLYGAAALAEGRLRRAAGHAALALGTVVAVSLVNPYGPTYARFLLHAWTLDRSWITEWEPLLSWPLLPFEALALLVALATAALALAGGLRAWRRRAAAPGATALAPALVLLLLAAMSLRAMRIQTFLALCAAGLLPLLVRSSGVGLLPGVERWARRRGRGPRVVVPALASALALLFIGAMALGRPLLSAVVVQQPAASDKGAAAFPAGAVRWLRKSPYSGRLLNPFTQGEFLLWTLYPKFRVAMDGRYEEVYSQEQFRDVMRFFVEAPSMWERQLGFAERSGADFVLFASHWPNLQRLAASPGWRTVYDDGAFALVGREATLRRYPPYAGPAVPVKPRLSIKHYFVPADLRRFAGYPSSVP